MMNSAVREQYSSSDDRQQTLIAMGFPEVLVQLVLEDSSPSASLEDLVMRLSAMMDAAEAQRPTPSRLQSGTSKSYNRLASEVDDNYQSLSYDAPGSLSTAPGRGDPMKDALVWFASYLRKEAPEYAPGPVESYSADVMMLFSTAEQILDAYQDMSKSDGYGSYSNAEMSNETMMLVQWAADIKDLQGAITTFCLDGYGTDETIAGSGGRSGQADVLVQRYCGLEDVRRRAEQSGATSAAEIRRMKALEAIASMGSSDEQQLHRYISRYEECQAEIEVVHRRIALLVSAGGVRREAIEELYLYLKEQVNSGVDLEALSEEMHDKVYTLVDSSKGGEVVGVLLDMHIVSEH